MEYKFLNSIVGSDSIINKNINNLKKAIDQIHL